MNKNKDYIHPRSENVKGLNKRGHDVLNEPTRKGTMVVQRCHAKSQMEKAIPTHFPICRPD